MSSDRRILNFTHLAVAIIASVFAADETKAADVTLAFRATADGAPLALDAPETLVAVGQNRLSLIGASSSTSPGAILSVTENGTAADTITVQVPLSAHAPSPASKS